jgi:hypothetical protein
LIDDDDDHGVDDGDEPSAAALDPDTVATGAAADSAADADDRLKGLPRILRYAMLINDRTDGSIAQRLIAEIDELCPGLPANIAWAADPAPTTGLALAAELDRLAVLRDLPLLRSLSDCARLLSVSLPCDAGRLGDFRRVTRAMRIAFDDCADDLVEEQRCDLERFIAGWATLPTAADMAGAPGTWPAVNFAARLGDQMARYRIRSAAADAARRVRRDLDRQPDATRGPDAATSTPARTAPRSGQAEPAPATPLPPHHVLVGRIDDVGIGSAKLKGIVEPVKDVLNIPLPLIETPALDQVRSTLRAEFPHAAAVIDFALADLIGRPVVKLRPLLLVGEPGGGKSRFARRFSETLGLSIWWVDAAQSDGAVLGGTDRRWHSAECCHPLLAIARGRSANPIILLDELEKAGTRTDYGRLWDCLLGLLEPETSSRYPDPALQIPLDLSHVNYLATANSLEPLPAPLHDRFRIVAFPKPALADLDALLPGLFKTLAAERGIDARWIAPLDPDERAAVTSAWPGGSVRRLLRILDAILQARDQHATRQ